MGIWRRLLQVQLHDSQYKFTLWINPLVEECGMHWVIHHCQFSVQLTFAMTINKTQGQLLQEVGVDLWEAVLTHGQLYVAPSRATSVAGARGLIKQDAHRMTLNIVIPEVLLAPLVIN